MPSRVSKQIATALRKADHILIVPHQNPDGDALGSATALMHYLRRMDKDHSAFCRTSYPPKMSYLPGIEHLTIDHAIFGEEIVDCIVVVDSGSLEYAGINTHIASMPQRPVLINIDHHATNTSFGDLNLVVVGASSTCEILYQFFMVNDIAIDAQMATCLLTGLITDTGNFTNSATTVTSLRIASDLMQKGGDMKLIQELVLKDTSLSALKLWGQVLSRLAKHDTHEIVYTYLTQKDLEEHGVDESEAEGIANFMNSLSEGKAALVLKEVANGKVKGSFRTTRDDVDVSAIAKELGGGGHKKAAGFTVEGTIESVLQKIWGVLDRLK